MRVAEMGGAWFAGDEKGSSAGWVRVAEVGKAHIDVSIGHMNVVGRPEQARSLARQLYRLARRVEKANAT